MSDTQSGSSTTETVSYTHLDVYKRQTFASIINNHPKSPIIDLQQQQLLLRMEYEHEKEEFKRQTETCLLYTSSSCCARSYSVPALPASSG